MSLDFPSEVSVEQEDSPKLFDDSLKGSISRRIITTLNLDTSELLHIPEVGEFDNDRVDNIIEQYDFETLLRFPWILIECFLHKNISNRELQKYSCTMKSTESWPWYQWIIELTWESLQWWILHLDWEENITLCYENMSIANIGLDGNFISQIQSASIYEIQDESDKSSMEKLEDICDYSHNYYVEWFNWKKVLVKLAERYLIKTEAPEAFIIWASGSSWSKVKSQSSPEQWWYNIYDQTALELWYKLDGNWRYVTELNK